MTGEAPSEQEMAQATVEALDIAFKSLGRVLVCLDEDFRVAHASALLDDYVGEGAHLEARGLPVQELLPEPLFSPGGELRSALARGERREGWRCHLLDRDGASHAMSVTVAPVHHEPGDPCDPRVRYLVVLRPDEESGFAGTKSPTGFSGMVARAPSMMRIFQLIESLRDSEATVLLTGESGTGKELAARAIHEHSPRRRGPFVAVNCGALPPDLLESELFGHVRGAFTGAVRDRKGRFELADEGTLFLDEVGDVPLALQVKLLRVLQERTFERVGDSHTLRTDARIVAATNRDLRRAMAEGDFRDDLFYRLRVVPIELPPLRERREDIEPIARVLLGRIGRRRGRARRLSPSSIAALMAYDWPGNVRELENALEYAVAICPRQTVHPEDLPPEVQAGRPVSSLGADPESVHDDDGEDAAALRRVLDSHQWNRAATAEFLGISRTTLWRRMREHGLLD